MTGCRFTQGTNERTIRILGKLVENRETINDTHWRLFECIIGWQLFGNTLRILYSTYVIRITERGNFNGATPLPPPPPPPSPSPSPSPSPPPPLPVGLHPARGDARRAEDGGGRGWRAQRWTEKRISFQIKTSNSHARPRRMHPLYNLKRLPWALKHQIKTIASRCIWCNERYRIFS